VAESWQTSRAVASAARSVPLGWLTLAAATSTAIGVAATFGPKIAVAVTVAALLAAAVALRPSLVLPAMIASVFIEIVSVGGIAVTRLIAPLACIVLVLALVQGTARIRSGPPLLWAAAYAFWALTSTLWTVDLGHTEFLLGSLAIALVYMFAFAGLLTSRRELQYVLSAFAVTAFAVGILAIVGFFLSLPFELESGRTSGGTGDPNFFATYQIIALPLVLVLASVAAKRWVRIALHVTVLIIIASVFTSVSRGGLLTLMIVVGLMLVLPARTVFRSTRQKAALLIIVAVGGFTSFQAAGPEVATRINSIFQQDKTGSGRLNDWRGAWLSIQERPVLGLGYGTFVGESIDLIRRTPGADLVNFQLREPGEAVHSVYIGTTAELGFPGLFLLLGLLVSTGRALRKTARRGQLAGDWFLARTANALFLGLVGWAFASIFLSSETSRSLWTIVGLTLALPKLLPSDAREEVGARIATAEALPAPGPA
jgi:O-antigen ligase